MKNTPKGFVVPLIITVIALITVGGGIYLYNTNQAPITDSENSNDGNIVACTKDAMICPDGSSVGRTGPNCEFVCPDIRP